MDKKNTLLLTVIAVATLLVAIVGATFAYFTAQVGNGAQAEIKVETKTVDIATIFQELDDIKIIATQENFAKGKGSLRGETTGYVSFVPTNDAGVQEKTRNYCYNVDIEISSNDFEYSLPKTHGISNDANYPELVLNIWKEKNVTDVIDGNVTEKLKQIDQGDTNLYSQSIFIDEEQHQLLFDNVLDSTRVCKTDKTTGLVSDDSSNCQDTQPIKGFDITEVGSSAESASSSLFHNVKKIRVPIKEGGAYAVTNFEHKLEAQAGSNTTVYDLWKVAVTFVNYSDNDLYNNVSADQHKNENKTLSATLKFTPLQSCSGE